MIEYEFPLNEKIRTLLRLEDLIARMEYFMRRDHQSDHHSALMTLLEIVEVASRSDLKSEILQELEKQKRSLMALQNNPAISENALEVFLGEIEQAANGILAMSGKVGQHVKECEWLMGIKQRSIIPGGTCQFDLPSYHYWLAQPVNMRRVRLVEWLSPMLPLRTGLEIILNLLRSRGKVMSFTARGGSFQQMQGGRIAQLLRVGIDEQFACIPEVSANKYAINIRFIMADFSAKTTLFEEDVPFQLTFCSTGT